MKKAFVQHNLRSAITSLGEDNVLVVKFLDSESYDKFGVFYENFFQQQLTIDKNRGVVNEFLSFLETNSSCFTDQIPPIKINSFEFQSNSFGRNYERNQDIYNSPYYNDDLDMDQQSQEFWENM